jgi:DNA-binding response OmpR family regulator
VVDADPNAASGPFNGDRGATKVTAVNVLVVDDEPAIRNLVAIALRSEGIDVSTAGNGELALYELERGDFDAIVLDLEMPIMDGWTFYRALRARNRYTPVLILSAYGSASARAELGADDALTKPFDPSELVEHVQKLATAA